MADLSESSRRVTPRSDPESLRGTFVVSFVLFLLVALCALLVGRSWRTWLPGAEGHKSLVDGVKASVHSFMPYLT